MASLPVVAVLAGRSVVGVGGGVKDQLEVHKQPDLRREIDRLWCEGRLWRREVVLL